MRCSPVAEARLRRSVQSFIVNAAKNGSGYVKRAMTKESFRALIPAGGENSATVAWARSAVTSLETVSAALEWPHVSVGPVQEVRLIESGMGLARHRPLS